MKKIFTFLILFVVILGANVNAQEVNSQDPHYYATVSFAAGNNIMESINYPDILSCPMYVGSAGLFFQYPISSLINWVLSGTINIGYIGGDAFGEVNLNTGVHINATKNLYWQVYLTPHMSIHGKGVQTNGDMFESWFALSTGPGFKLDLPYGHVFLEVGFSKDIDIIYGHNYQHDEIFMTATIGYRYLIR